MISELTSTILPADAWGNKASRLSEVNALGLAVPPGLCIQYAAALQSPMATDEALSAWLELYRPRAVVARMSSVLEDQLDMSNAGKTVSILDCMPIPSTLIEVLNEQLLPFAAPWASSGGGLSFFFQYQIMAQFGGVAFLIGDRLVVEAETQSTKAITTGDEPAVRIELAGGNLQAAGTVTNWPITTIASALFRACSSLRAHFGFDVDVEWAWSKGVLYVLQVRPVTVSL